MKIAVLVKQVPDTESRICLKPDGSGVDETNIKWVLNPYDEYAIEAALQLQQKTSGEVIVISAGPPRVVDAMRTALAMGADRAIRINTDGVSVDPFTTALMLAACLKDEGCDIVLGGKQAVDDDASQVLLAVAERLSMPVVGVVEKLAISDDGKGLTLHRPVSGGLKEVITLVPPVVIGCDKGINTPRYPSLPGIMKAKAKPVDEKDGAALLGGESPRFSYSNYGLPPERVAGRKVTGDAADVAQQLTQWLRDEVKIL